MSFGSSQHIQGGHTFNGRIERGGNVPRTVEKDIQYVITKEL